jgi:hypothetical protein
MATTNKVFVQINDEVIELKGNELSNWEDERKQYLVESQLLEAEYKAKQDARDSAIKKLGEIAGLTKDELNAIL